jgi:hypothetical protein
MAQTTAPVPALHFPANGYSIAPLEGQPGKDAVYTTMSMSLPPADGISSNVNVQIQPFDGTLDAFIALSNQQFKQLKFTRIKQTIAADCAQTEYTGNLQNMDFHWYSKVVKKGRKVYIVTATAPMTQWVATSARLMSCVDSFQLDKN